MADQRLERGTIWCSLVLAAVLSGCLVTRRTDPPGLDQTLIQRCLAERGWLVHDGEDRVVGSVVRYEEPLGKRRFLYSVRNLHGQDMGMVDQLGRAYRYRPHAEPEWLSTGPVREGALAILGLGLAGELEEIPLERLEARVLAASGR